MKDRWTRRCIVKILDMPFSMKRWADRIQPPGRYGQRRGLQRGSSAQRSATPVLHLSSTATTHPGRHVCRPEYGTTASVPEMMRRCNEVEMRGTVETSQRALRAPQTTLPPVADARRQMASGCLRRSRTPTGFGPDHSGITELDLGRTSSGSTQGLRATLRLSPRPTSRRRGS